MAEEARKTTPACEGAVRELKEAGTCRTCRFYDPQWAQGQGPGEFQQIMGRCKRCAPRPGVGSSWPLLHADEWCGEHELASPPKVPSATAVASLVAQVLQEPSGHEDAIASALHAVIRAELHFWCGHRGLEMCEPFEELSPSMHARAVCNFEKFIDSLHEQLEER